MLTPWDFQTSPFNPKAPEHRENFLNRDGPLLLSMKRV